MEKRLFDLWTATVRDRLPSIFIPLSEGDPDVVLDLQPCLDRTYDEGRYQGDIDYSSDPPVPLPPDDASWADALLREKGLRPPAAG